MSTPTNTATRPDGFDVSAPGITVRVTRAQVESELWVNDRTARSMNAMMRTAGLPTFRTPSPEMRLSEAVAALRAAAHRKIDHVVDLAYAEDARRERDAAWLARVDADPANALSTDERDSLRATDHGTALLSRLRAGHDVAAQIDEYLACRRELGL